MLSILFRLSLVCLIGYGGFRVFKEQMTARFCRAEAKKLESRFEDLLILDSNRIHLRKMNSDASFASWLFYAPAGKAFEMQLQTQTGVSTIMRVPSKSSGHYGLIQMQFASDDSLGIPAFKSFDVFGPDFKHYVQTAGKDAIYTDPCLMLVAVGREVNPIDMKSVLAPLSPFGAGFDISIANQPTHVFCDSNQKAVLAYFTEVEMPGTAKIKHADFAVTVRASKE